MPLADLPGLIASDFEGFGNRGVALLESKSPVGDVELGVRTVLSGNEGGEVELCRSHSGHDRCAAGGTDRAGGVGIRELHPTRGELVEMRGFVKIAFEAGEARPTEVVGKKQDDVGFVVSCLGECKRKSCENQKQPAKHAGTSGKQVLRASRLMPTRQAKVGGYQHVKERFSSLSLESVAGGGSFLAPLLSRLALTED